MPRGNHFMVHKLIFRPQVALETLFRAMNHVTSIDQTQSNRFLVRPRTGSMRTKPRGSRPMAIFAGHALGDFKRPPALLGRSVKRMTCQAFRSFLGPRA